MTTAALSKVEEVSGLPDMKVSVRQVFGIDSDLEVPAYSEADEHVPDTDPDYLFDRETTLAILAGFIVPRLGLVRNLAADASLSNTADLVVGKGFAGCFEYLRIARSTLADSRTSIEELYDWEFDGPFLRDFAGREVTGKRRDAGAFEFEGSK